MCICVLLHIFSILKGSVDYQIQSRLVCILVKRLYKICNSAYVALQFARKQIFLWSASHVDEHTIQQYFEYQSSRYQRSCTSVAGTRGAVLEELYQKSRYQRSCYQKSQYNYSSASEYWILSPDSVYGGYKLFQLLADFYITIMTIMVYRWQYYFYNLKYGYTASHIA